MWAWRWLAGLALLAVLIGSLAPGHVTVVPFDLPDQKHFLAYAVLGFLFVMAFQANWWQALLVVLGLALIGFGVDGAGCDSEAVFSVGGCLGECSGGERGRGGWVVCLLVGEG